MSTNLQAIILAAGKSTRFNTGNTKLLEPICGLPMILYSIKLFEQLHIPITMVVGYQKDLVRETVNKYQTEEIHFVTQKEKCGTGHAILCARDSWQEEHILIINGDVPLVTKTIIESLYKKHRETNAAISFVTAHADPSSAAYGKVIQNENGIKIVEARNFEGDSSQHCCINAGIYIVTKEFLEKNITEIERNEKSKEFYLTDLIKIASDKGYTVSTVSAPFDRIRGINTFQELWATEQIKRSELIKYWMNRGVRFFVAQNVHIDLDVTIGSGSYIGCGVHLLNGTKIGQNCTINAFSSLDKTKIADNVTIDSHCIIKDAIINQGAQVGPFAHIRSNTVLEDNAVIGNFVEVKHSNIGKNSKAKHLSYLGDANIGSNVNIGAGTITCNHDGQRKHKTIIEDNVFVGSNNTIVAPLTIHESAFTAAGSTITKNVPAHAVAFGRSRQINKEKYAQKLRNKNRKNTDNQKVKSKKGKDTNSLSFIGAIKTDADTNNTAK